MDWFKTLQGLILNLTGTDFKPHRDWWSLPVGQWQLLILTVLSLLPASTRSPSSSMISGATEIIKTCVRLTFDFVGQVLWQGPLFFLQTSSRQPRNWVDWTQVLSRWQGKYLLYSGGIFVKQHENMNVVKIKIWSWYFFQSILISTNESMIKLIDSYNGATLQVLTLQKSLVLKNHKTN